MASRTPANVSLLALAERLDLQVQNLVEPVDRHQRVLELQIHRGQALQRLQQVAQQRVEEHQLADRQRPVHDAVAAVPEDHDAGHGGDERPQGVHADAELLEGEDRLDQPDQACLPLLGAQPLGAEGLDRLDAGDVFDQVGRELGGLLHRRARAPPRRRVVHHRAQHQQRHEGRRHQRQRPS